MPRPCLLRHQMMRRSQGNLRGEIPALFAAQRAGDHNGLKRECSYTGRHVPPASFALHHEQLSSLNSEGHQNQCRRIYSESLHEAPASGGGFRALNAIETYQLNGQLSRLQAVERNIDLLNSFRNWLIGCAGVVSLILYTSCPEADASRPVFSVGRGWASRSCWTARTVSRAARRMCAGNMVAQGVHETPNPATPVAHRAGKSSAAPRGQFRLQAPRTAQSSAVIFRPECGCSVQCLPTERAPLMRRAAWRIAPS